MTRMTYKNFDPITQKNISIWLDGNYDDEIKEEIRELIKNHPEQAIDAFYTNLSFGTGGMRGIMGVGCNRINAYTVRAAIQGLASYLKKNISDKKKSVFIGYDSRHHSRFFAEEAAKVLAANEIEVYLCKNLRPTPLVSFGCRYLKCQAALMITASHNPPEYNGFKVYGSDGGQIHAPQDKEILKQMDETMNQGIVKITSISNSLIHWVEEEIDEAYLTAISALQNCPQENHEHGHQLKVVYSNLHGTGITLVPRLLKEWGFSNQHDVEAQKKPDGNFPTIKSPNPEEPSALQLGIETLKQVQGDILLITDPDADRLGVVVMHQSDIIVLNGHQIASLCLEHICKAKALPKNGAVIKSIVTSELFKEIATDHSLACFDTLPGFKYIAEKIQQWESEKKSYQFIFGVEESYGYLFGSNTRDKDAVATSALICEIALQAKLKNKTLVDLLHVLYQKYGIYREKALNLYFEEGKKGREEVVILLMQLRNQPPLHLNHIPIIEMDDYLTQTKRKFPSGVVGKLMLPKSNGITFWLEDGTKLTIRPSGTEPKIKIYCEVVEKHFTELDAAIQACDARIDQCIASIEKYMLTRSSNT